MEVCEIYLAASKAKTWGEPLALEALPDGGEDVYFPPKPGVYDGAAVDCDDELVEEQAGMDLRGEFIWVIGEQALANPVAEAADSAAAPAPLEVGGVLAAAGARGLVWDTGFRATANGFGFENYGGDFPEGNFTAADAAGFWGDKAICASGSGEGCIPKPSAQAWIDAANAGGDGGHCAGFTVAAFRLFDGELDPAPLGAASIANLQRSIPVMRRIALDFQMQSLPEILAATAELHAVGPGFAFAASGVQAGAGQTAGDAITINPAAGSVNYAPAGAAKPVLTLTTAGAAGETVFTLGGVSFEAGQQLTVQVDPTAGTLALSGTNIGKDNLVLVATKVGNDGAINTFATDGIVLAAAGSQVLDFGAWDGTGAMSMGLDADGDGALESTRELADEPLGAVINDLGSAAQISEGMAASAAYMDDADTASFLAALAVAGFSADEFGSVLQSLNEANFSAAELQAFVVEAKLADDLGLFAGFAHALGLDAEEFSGLTEALGFDAAALETLSGLMDEQQALEDNAYELARADLDPAEQAAFIAALGLTPDQLGDFLDFSDIDGAKLAGVLTDLQVDPQQLPGLLNDLDLEAEDLGAVLVGLDLQGGAEISLIDGLGLDAADLGDLLLEFFGM